MRYNGLCQRIKNRYRGLRPYFKTQNVCRKPNFDFSPLKPFSLPYNHTYITQNVTNKERIDFVSPNYDYSTRILRHSTSERTTRETNIFLEITPPILRGSGHPPVGAILGWVIPGGTNKGTRLSAPGALYRNGRKTHFTPYEE